MQKKYGQDSQTFPTKVRSCRRQRFSCFVNLRHLGIRGRRKQARRKEERINFYVDLYNDPILFLVVLAIIVMSTFDAVFTLILLESGNIVEANPLMAALIEKGGLYFFYIKYTLTALSLCLLVIHKNFTFLKIFRATHVLFLIFSGFLLLNVYQILLLLNRA